MKILLIVGLILLVLLWPLYLYANRPGQPSDDWGSAFWFMADLVLAAFCLVAWLVWALLRYLFG